MLKGHGYKVERKEQKDWALPKQYRGIPISTAMFSRIVWAKNIEDQRKLKTILYEDDYLIGKCEMFDRMRK